MKKTTFTDAQIISILKQAEQGVPVAQFCREHGMGNPTFYKWWVKYGGMDVSLMAKIKSLGGIDLCMKITHRHFGIERRLISYF